MRRKLTHIYDVKTAQKFNIPPRCKTVVVFDIDNTLLQPLEGDLGSDQWFDALFQQISVFKSYPEIYQQLVQLILNLYYEVQQHIQVKPVEQAIVDYFNLLKRFNIRVILVTARGVDLAERTVQQLKNIGLDIQARPEQYQNLGKGNTDQPPAYQGNIIYCSGNHKGKCFRAFLELKKINPSHFYVIDDKLKNVHDILHGLKWRKYSIFKGYRYGYLDEHIKNFKIEEVNQQIISLGSKVSRIAELCNQLFVMQQQDVKHKNLWQATLFNANTSNEKDEFERNDEHVSSYHYNS